MKFLIATAALLSALVIAKPVNVDVHKIRDSHPAYAGCTIIGDCPVPVRTCASEDSEVCPVVMEYHPGQNIYFDCYVEGPEVENTHDDITSIYWDRNTDGYYFPEAYVEAVCAETIDQVCQ